MYMYVKGEESSRVPILPKPKAPCVCVCVSAMITQNKSYSSSHPISPLIPYIHDMLYVLLCTCRHRIHTYHPYLSTNVRMDRYTTNKQA